MQKTRRGSLLALALMCAVAGVYLWAADKPAEQKESREKLTKAARDGNYKVAYEGLRKLALDPKDDPKQVAGGLDLAIDRLQNLGRVDEVDEFREAVIAAPPKNWRLLQTAALSFRKTPAQGFIVAG